VLLIRRIRDLLYDQGFTISGARNQWARHGRRQRKATAVKAVTTATMRAARRRRRRCRHQRWDG